MQRNLGEIKITINISILLLFRFIYFISFLVSDIFLANLVLICHQSSQKQKGNPIVGGKIKGFKILLIEEHRKHHLKAF